MGGVVQAPLYVDDEQGGAGGVVQRCRDGRSVTSRTGALARSLTVMLSTTMTSPVGELVLAGDETALRGLYFPNHPLPEGLREARAPFAGAIEQLEQYFAGERREFDLQLELAGPAFHKRVWEALTTIPYGETRSYGQIAAQVGDPGAARAVGFANGRNPIAIVVPCHRVIGADGSLTGYGGGLPRKRHLLDLEAGRLALTA